MIVTIVSTPLTSEVGNKIHMKKHHGHALFHIMNVHFVDNQLNYFTLQIHMKKWRGHPVLYNMFVTVLSDPCTSTLY